MTIGTVIRKFRELNNVSREQMADYLGISFSTYKKIELNLRKPSLDEIKIISNKLELDPHLFLEQNLSNNNTGDSSNINSDKVLSDMKILTQLIASNNEVLGNLKSVMEKNCEMIEVLVNKISKE